MKANARKVRRLGKGDVIAGFAGATADAFALFERLEAKLEQHPGNLARACVELAKDWRTEQISAPARSDDGGGGCEVDAHPVRHRRCGRAGRRRGRHRLRRALCAVRRARAAAASIFRREEIARRAMKIAADICVYTNDNIIIESITSHEFLHAARNRFRTRPLHRRPGRRQARRRHRAAQSLAAAAARAGIARRSAAEEHSDDRADRRRQDGDFAPSGQARAGAVHQGRSDEVHRSRLCRPRRGADRARSASRVGIAQVRERRRRDVEAQAEARAEERVLDALVGANASAPTREAFRKRLRAGELDDKEIELEMRDAGGGAADVRNSRHAGRADRHGQSRRHARQGVRQQGPRRAA